MTLMLRARLLALPAAAFLSACEHARNDAGDYEAGAGIEEEDAAEIPGAPYDLLYAGEGEAPLLDGDPLPAAERLVDPQEDLGD